jgi:hypothetical protein
MTDPLSHFYRTKEIFVKLPSKGHWYKQKPNLTADGEVGVYPMSVKDEVLFKVPDTLYNGDALFEVLKSIAPDIVDPYEICLVDVDVLLIASRASLNDGEMNVSARCPHCNKTHEYGIDLSSVLANVKHVKTDPVELELQNGLIIVFKPNTLASITASHIQNTESVRIAAQITDDTDPAYAKELFKASLEKTAGATIIVLADSIEKIVTPDGKEVNEIESISRWLANTDSKTIELIKKHSSVLNENGIQKDFKFICSNDDCGEEFNSPLEYNPAFFFTHNLDKQKM